MATEIKKVEEKDNKTKSLKWQRDRDQQKVKGIFRFHEVPGGVMSFVYKGYKDDKVERYDMIDGQIYEVPLGVARHLNKNLWYPQYEYVKGEQMANTGYREKGYESFQKVSKKVRRCSFQSLEFLDEVDLTPDGLSILTVETTSPINY